MKYTLESPLAGFFWDKNQTLYARFKLSTLIITAIECNIDAWHITNVIHKKKTKEYIEIDINLYVFKSFFVWTNWSRKLDENDFFFVINYLKKTKEENEDKTTIPLNLKNELTKSKKGWKKSCCNASLLNLHYRHMSLK